MPKFSVVISVFNKEEFIAQTLDSVMAQTEQDFEIVILNDGSTDQSEDQIQPYLRDKRIRYFSEENQGAAAGRNFVIKKATGNYIALLDADDLWEPYYLEEQARLIGAYPKESVFATNSNILKKERSLPREFSVELPEDGIIVTDYFEASYLDSILHSSTTVLHRDVFEKVGYYDPSIRSGQDTDLYVRIGLQFPVVFSNRVCVLYRFSDNSLFRSSRKLKDKPTFETYEAYEKDRPALKKFLDLNRYSLCILAKLEGNEAGFQLNLKKIDPNNLNRKQRFLLRQSQKNLKQLLRLKDSIAQLGIRLSAFK